ncbi:PIN domain-containing protein [Geobacter argillaceus]|uniref:Ribonuclease VapC n=1 Tax=Geobacter argillaceus TaxID=345631 RepID=A0A562UZX2_9BACT|nr:PIN domain-containing protein [Geobacter argillaceus]TWJ11122.1 putative nucleic acid-binding protein [Geobacter argillaceus]
MKGKVFFDSNLWVYLNSRDPKAAVVSELVNSHFSRIIVSSQVLGEIYHVLVRKGFTDKETAREIVSDLQESFIIAPVTSATVSSAVTLNIRHGYSYWDSLIIASALENGCTTLFSEDLHHTQRVDGRLAIINPFA